MRAFIKLLLILAISTNCIAQDSSRLRISLLTCDPGDELYSLFGHSAIRVIDSNSVTDIVYNYGTFNFDDEGFYLKFVQGRLLYYISAVHFEDFKFDYQSTGRGITEQMLSLTQSEKIRLRDALNENLKEENRYYMYDFFLDNCTTRLRDLIVKYKQPTPHLPAVMPANTRFREAIHQYLDNGGQLWSKLGIDILLGAPTDIVMSSSQQQFLPHNLMFAIDSSNIPLVASKTDLYTVDENKEKQNWFTPTFFFWALLIVFILIAFGGNRFKGLLTGLDGLLFFCTGALGIILIFMWTGTDHSMTKDNYNLLWAWPTHILISFLINSRKRWVKIYFLGTAIFLSCVLLAWFFLPQQMNNALIPFVLLLIYRSAIKWTSYGTKKI